MRPIERGANPNDENNNKIIFVDYGNAKPFLINKIGDYCSFCERKAFSSALDIEHILPKSLPEFEYLTNNWDNFLLACKNCNSVKATIFFQFNDIYLPDRNNTFLIFEILEGGLIKINKNLTEEQKTKTQNLVNLVGLDRKPGHKNFSSKDERWKERKTTWELAERYKQKHIEGKADEETIIDLAKSIGFWTVWMTVFKEFEKIKQLLINNFKGTAQNCFQNTEPINRNNFEI